MDNNSTKNWFYNIGAALVVFGVLIFTVYLALGWYTKHDVKIPVPNVVGQTVSNAEIMMQNEGLTVKIIDSVYNEKAEPFSIIEQIPAAGNEVKPGRAIYVVINSGNKPKIKMPKLVDQSLTLATAVLKNNGLVLGEISYSFDEIGNNLVISQKINGREVAPGTLLTKGTRIDLVIISNDKDKFPDAIDSTSSGDETTVPEDIGN
jgi:eukaryotic-like serine/threonine-protein kinase